MRRAFPLALTLAALGTGAAPAGAAETPAGPSAETPAYAPARVIVQYKPGAQRADARDDVDATSVRPLDLPRTELVGIPAGSSVPAAVRELQARDDVAFAQPDLSYKPESLPDDPFFPANQWGLDNTGQHIPPPSGTQGTPDADIDAPFAWDVTTGSDSVIVGVIDSGVNVAHEDLADNIFVNSGETPGDDVDNDGNGHVDDVSGWDFVNDDANVSDDALDHGTLVASVLGGRGNNGIGTTGVSQHVKILPVQVANSNGTLSSSGIVNGIGYARDLGARVVNMSFGHYGATEDQALIDAVVASPNILFSASAGNLNSLNQANDNDAAPHWPSNLSQTHDNVISEANTTNTDALSDDSSFGAQSVDIAAPGTLIAGASAQQYSEDFDGVTAPAFPTGWTTDGAWAVTEEDSFTGDNSITDSPGGDYAQNSDTSAMSPAFDVPADATCAVRSLRKRQLGAGDAFLVEASVDGGPWSTIDTRTTSAANWVIGNPTFTTGPTAEQAQVRFRLTSDDNPTVANGVYVDDVAVICTGGDEYVFGSGTSFATPMTTGTAALLLAEDPGLTAAQLKTTLKDTVDPLPGLAGKVRTGGRLNAGRAVHSLIDPGATTQPADEITAGGAKLHGDVDPTGSTTSVHFEYRLVDAPTWTPTGSAPVPDAAPVQAETTLTGLAADSDYEFRVVASKPLRSHTGDTLTFHTTTEPPVDPNGGGGGPTPPPTQTTTNPPPTQPIVVPPVKDTTAPRLSGLKVAPTAFLPLRAGASIARALKKKTTPRGATLRFRVSERSSISARVLVRKTGRRKGRSCVAPTRANRKARACVRYVATGGATKLSGTFSGLATRRLSGRVKSKALKAGTYRLELTPTDAAGNRGRPANVAFRIATR